MKEESFDIPIINTVIKFDVGGEWIEVYRVMLAVMTLEEYFDDIAWEFGYPYKGLVPQELGSHLVITSMLVSDSDKVL